MWKKILTTVFDKTAENKETATVGGISLTLIVVFAYQTFVQQTEFDKTRSDYNNQITLLWRQIRLDEYALATHGIIVPINVDFERLPIKK